MLLENRRQAGELLSEKLAKMKLRPEVLVLALPRGGVPVAAAIAQRLAAPLDLLLVKKIGAPEQPELALGAVTETEIFWDQETLDFLEISPAEQNALAAVKRQELGVEARKWRSGRSPIDAKNKTVILVDDGMATGASMLAALHALKAKRPRRLIVAVPVASRHALEAIKAQGDEIVCLHVPAPFFSVGQWYEDFAQVSDHEVEELMRGVLIPSGDQLLEGELNVPPDAKGLVIFAHGSGSSRHSPRHRKVAAALNTSGFATLLFDLLISREAEDRAFVFNIELLIARLKSATQWAAQQEDLRHLAIGYFGASTGAAAALGAAADDPKIKAVVSRGGRPDLASAYLRQVRAPVLLIVGEHDREVLTWNEQAKRELPRCEIVIIPGAGHLFEEGHALDDVATLAAHWFQETL